MYVHIHTFFSTCFPVDGHLIHPWLLCRSHHKHKSGHRPLRQEFISFRSTLRCGSYGSLIFNDLRICLTIFYSLWFTLSPMVCEIFLSYQLIFLHLYITAILTIWGDNSVFSHGDHLSNTYWSFYLFFGELLIRVFCPFLSWAIWNFLLVLGIFFGIRL